MGDIKDNNSTYDNNADPVEYYNLSGEVISDIIDNDTETYLRQNTQSRSALTLFLSKHGREIKNTDDYTHIDQHLKQKWFIHPNAIQDLTKLLEQFRINKNAHGISERQGGIARLFIDGDIKLSMNKSISKNQNMFRNILGSMIPTIFKNIVPTDEYKTSTAYAYCESRSACTFDNKALCYKDGFHIRFSVLLPQNVRKNIINKIAEEKKYQTYFLQHRDVIKNIPDIIDLNSATVMVLQPGGTKGGGVLYEKMGIFKIMYSHLNEDSLIDLLTEDETKDWNIVEKFGPIYVSKNDNNFTTTPVISPSFEKSLEKMDTKMNSSPFDIESNDISINSINDPLHREISQILELLSKTRSEDYKSWWKVLICLAHYGDKYKSLARSFSIQTINKFDESEFESKWKKCLLDCSKYSGINIGFLKKIAKMDDSIAYGKISDGFIIHAILNSTNDSLRFMSSKSAKLGHYTIAYILHTAFPDKYVAVPKIGGNGKKMADDSDVNYYSMMTKDCKEYIDGSAYKYISIMSMAPLNIYISVVMPRILEQVRSYFKLKKDEPDQKPELITYYSSALSVIGKAFEFCMDNNAKKNIMAQFALLCTDFKFSSNLDKHPYAFGMYDSILETGVEPHSIQSICEYRVSRYTLSRYIIMDPQEIILQKTMQVFLDFVIIEEFDVICFILLAQSTSLSKKQKSAFLINMYGNGSNGKSTLVQFLASALGAVTNNGYSHRMEMDYFTKEKQNSGTPTSDIIPLQHATFATTSEPGDNEYVIESKIKGILSGELISARDLNEKQITFAIICLIMITSNRELRYKENPKQPRLIWDKGTKRRIKYILAKKEYTNNPNPENPLQCRTDSKVLLEMVPSPIYGGALISILSIVHAVYIMLHNQDIENICSPNVEKETVRHIESYDKIGKFISARCVISEKTECKIDNMVDRFIDWYDTEYEEVKQSRSNIVNAFLASDITNYIKNIKNEHWTVGIRALSRGETPSPGESYFLKSDQYNFKHFSDFTLPPGTKLPFDGRIKPTLDARSFLTQLNTLHAECLVGWREKHGRDVNYIT